MAYHWPNVHTLFFNRSLCALKSQCHYYDFFPSDLDPNKKSPVSHCFLYKSCQRRVTNAPASCPITESVKWLKSCFLSSNVPVRKNAAAGYSEDKTFATVHCLAWLSSARNLDASLVLKSYFMFYCRSFSCALKSLFLRRFSDSPPIPSQLNPLHFMVFFSCQQGQHCVLCLFCWRGHLRVCLRRLPRLQVLQVLWQGGPDQAEVSEPRHFISHSEHLPKKTLFLH